VQSKRRSIFVVGMLVASDAECIDITAFYPAFSQAAITGIENRKATTRT